MKLRYFAVLSLVLIGFMLLNSCSFGRPTATQYYVLDYLPTPDPKRKQKDPFPYEILVKDFDIAEAYRRKQIVYRQSAQQMQFYDYHRWAVDPELMITDLITKHLKEAKIVNNVLRNIGSFVPTFYLSGKVMALEEYDSKDQWFAHLAIDYSLENATTGTVLWQKSFDVRKTVAQEEPVFVIRELSALLEFVNDKMIHSLNVAIDEYHYNQLQDTTSETSK